MKNLTDNNTAFPPQRTPENGNAGSGPTFELCFQDAANRAAYNKKFLDNGVTRIRVVSSVAELKALGGTINTGDVAMLVAAGTRGLYVYDAATPMPTDLPPFGYGSSALAGRWLSGTAALTNLTAGIAPSALRFDPQTILTTNAIVRSFEAVFVAPQTIASGGAWKDTGVTTAQDIAMMVGDVATARCPFPWALDTGTEVASFRLAAVQPDGSTIAITYSEVDNLPVFGANKAMQGYVEGRFAATQAGNHAFKLQTLVSSGIPFNLTLGAPRALRGQVIRP